MSDTFDGLFTFGGIADMATSPGRPCILLVSHDATQTGAPYILLWLAEALQKLDRFDVRIVTRSGGPLVDDFARVAPLCKGAEHCDRMGIGSADFAAVIASEFSALRPRGLVVCNTLSIQNIMTLSCGPGLTF